MISISRFSLAVLMLLAGVGLLSDATETIKSGFAETSVVEGMKFAIQAVVGLILLSGAGYHSIIWMIAPWRDDG